jgi:hypothetical protein
MARFCPGFVFLEGKQGREKVIVLGSIEKVKEALKY